MKKLKTFAQFINEAAPAPSKPTPTVTPPPPEDDEEEKKPAATPAPGTDAAPTDTDASPNDTTEPGATPDASAAGDVPDLGGAAPDASGGATGGAPGGTPGMGGAPAGGPTSSAGTADASGLGSPPSSSGDSGSFGNSDGASLGEPLSDEGTGTAPKPDSGTQPEQSQENYIPPVSKFNLVLVDKNAKWEQEYPDGGGVKDMQGYEVTWKDLNKWITQNGLANKKQDIAEYLMGENDDLDPDTKEKLKNAFTSKTLGEDTGETEVEYDNDLTPYVQDINTILVDL